MPSVPSLKNTSSVLEEFRTKLKQRAGITNFGTETIARTLGDVLSRQIVDGRNQSRFAFQANQLTTAKGRDLDSIILTRTGLDRLQAAFASSDRTEANFMFYVDGSTFGSINGGAGFTIPKGTVVRSPVNSLGNPIAEYTLTEDVVCASTDSIQFASIKARAAGASQNVGAGALTEHGFTSYIAATGLQCVNVYPILNGADKETEEQYKYRGSTYNPSIRAANDSRMRLANLKVPGVLEVRVIPGYLGIGTAGCVVFGAEGYSTAALVRDVQRQLTQSQVPGLAAIAVPGITVYLDFEMRLFTSRSLTQVEQNRLTAGVTRTIRNYLAQLTGESTLDLEYLRQLILSENSELLGVTTRRGRDQLFDKVYVRRGYGVSLTSSDRVTMTAEQYALDQDEYAVLGNLDLEYRVAVR